VFGKNAPSNKINIVLPVPMILRKHLSMILPA
jgi:hypothetical protein